MLSYIYVLSVMQTIVTVFRGKLVLNGHFSLDLCWNWLIIFVLKQNHFDRVIFTQKISLFSAHLTHTELKQGSKSYFSELPL